MSLHICALASGSKGNSTLVAGGRTKILIDAGISCRAVESKLAESGVKPTELEGILITHTHSDHIAGVGRLAAKYGLKVYTHHANAERIESRIGVGAKVVPLDGTDFYLGDFTVSPFEVNHDVHCYGYSIYCAGKKVSVLTDLGKITPDIVSGVKDSDILMIESNHDTEKLRNNVNYSAALKHRIMSDRGHLSNEDCSAAILTAVGCRARQVMLAHLSEENNSPELAYTIAKRTLEANGIVAGFDVMINVAVQNRISKILRCI